MIQYGLPGMAVAVTLEGRSQVFTYGVTDRDTKRPVTRDTLFEIGSLSKTFTATLATYAQATGKLSLDDRPGTYLPALRGSAVDAASLLQLGTYASGGLPLQFPDSVTTDEAMIGYFRRWKPVVMPGTHRQYSNPSIGLFGHVAALALGGDFATLAERDLFPQLGLRNSHVRVPPAAMERYAWGHTAAGKPVRVGPGVFDAEAYGVKSSAADLIRFVEVNLQPGLLPADLRRAVEATQRGHFRVGAMVQGLGWEQLPWPVAQAVLLAGNDLNRQPHPAIPLVPPQETAGQSRLFNKSGSTNGFAAYAAFVPAKRIGIVLLANRNFPIPARVTAVHAALEALAQ